LAATGKTFDVVVADDADRLAPDLLERVARSRLHRLGVAAAAGTTAGIRNQGAIMNQYVGLDVSQKETSVCARNANLAATFQEPSSTLHSYRLPK
jgi:hypothetical protein